MFQILHHLTYKNCKQCLYRLLLFPIHVKYVNNIYKYIRQTECYFIYMYYMYIIFLKSTVNLLNKSQKSCVCTKLSKCTSPYLKKMSTVVCFEQFNAFAAYFYSNNICRFADLIHQNPIKV